LSRVTSKIKAVTPTPTNFANRMVVIALSQYSCVNSHKPISLSGNSGSTGTKNTISVIAGDNVSTRSASHCLKVRSGISATTRATIGSRWSHSHASIRKMIASRTQNG